MSSAFQPRLARWPAPARLVAGCGWAVAVLVGWLSATGHLPPLAVGSGLFGSGLPGEVATAAAEAERAACRWQDVLRARRAAAGIRPGGDSALDPSGLLGEELTPLVTTLGSLEAKRVATNPAWARALTVRLAQAGIGRGDLVAASLSGSFPGLNLSLIAACRALGARLVAVSSVTASTWGANQPGFTWPEMEAALVESGEFARVSAAVTAGGDGDVAADLDDEGRALAARVLASAAARLGVPALRPGSLQEAVEQRLAVYDRVAKGGPIALYANVGGAHASLGRSAAILKLRPGILPGVPFDRSADRGVTARFAERRVKLLMLLNVRELALRWGVPLAGR